MNKGAAETQNGIMMNSQVILVDEQDNELGVMDKLQAHQLPVLHRAFSIFIFNSKKEMLLQKRAAGKYHSAGLWTNACCSHPSPGEQTEVAAHRRLQEEMGFETTLEKIFSFTYKTDFENGLGEHEYDHVFAGFYDGSVHPNAEEAGDHRFLDMETIAGMLQEHPEQYTVWFQLAFPRIAHWLEGHKP
jgi:isopentenyl-diphosphate Delta-isomerase